MLSRLGDGVLQIRASSGDPLRQKKTGQLNAFQFGVGSQEGPFTAHARLPAPSGDLDRFAELPVAGDLPRRPATRTTTPSWLWACQGFEFWDRGRRQAAEARPSSSSGELLGFDAVDLFLAGRPGGRHGRGPGSRSPGRRDRGHHVPMCFASREIPRSWLDNPDSGLAVGIISTTGRRRVSLRRRAGTWSR